MPIYFDQGSNLAAPGPIGGTTPAVGNFTDLNSTDLDVTTGTKTASDPVSFTQTWNAGAVVFTGLDTDDGRRVVVAVDHRMARDIVDAMPEGPVPAFVEPWQVLGRGVDGGDAA